MLIDTHAHLFWESFQNDLDDVIKRSLDAGVETIINVGVDVELSKKAAHLTSDKIKFYSSIGIHPHEAVKFMSDPDRLIKAAILELETIYYENPQKIIAVGECGLDYLFESNPDWIPKTLLPSQVKHLQEKLFQSQIDLAKKLDLPLLVHCRDDRSKDPQNSDCWNKILEMTKTWKGILHCYSGLPPITRNLPPNFLVSFAATLTYPKNTYLVEAVKMLPLEKIVLETDCPFLPPQPKRGQRNEPATVKIIAEMIAQIKDLSLETVEDQTTQNAKALLRIN